MHRMEVERSSLPTAGRAVRYPLVLVALLAVVVAVTGCPPPDVTPPGSVTGLTALPGDAQVELNWTNPADEDFAGVTIVRRTDTYPTSATDGTAVSVAAPAQTYLDTGLDNGTPYFYAVFAYDEVPNYAVGTLTDALPTAATAAADVLDEYDGLQDEIADVPDEVLDEGQRGELADLLVESELLYRAGDDCGAAASIIGDSGVLAKLQTFRAAGKAAKNDATVETSEALYNRSRMVRYNMLEGLAEKDLCPGQERVGMVAEAEVEEEDNTKVLALAELGEPKVLTVEEAEEEELFTQVVVPGADSKVGVPGMPAVPFFRRLIAVPIDAKVVLNTQLGKQPTESIYMNLYPFQDEPVDQGDPPDDSVFADPPFVKNDDFYAGDEWYPPEDELVKLTEMGEMRDVRMVMVEVAGGQYNPYTNELRLFEDHDVDVDFQGGKGAFITEASDHAFEDARYVYTGAVLNKASIPIYVAELEYIPVLLGEELLIMTHPDFLTAANDLATFKRSIGISTKVVQCGTGSSMTGLETNTEIDTWIYNHYYSVFVRPSYILLFGDAEFIAPFDSTTSTIGTDWPYAILGTPGVDNCPDFGVGRIPVDTAAEAATVVANIIAYEDTPPGDCDFYSHAAIASQFQCCRSGSPSGRAQRTFAEVSEFSRNAMMMYGKTVDRIYQKSGSGTPERYYDGALLPAALGLGSGYPWNGSNADIINAWNDRRFLYIHRDHGWEDGWVHPPFDWGDFGSLTSGAYRPVVFSVNCASGLFDNETAPGVYGTSTTGRYFAERMLLDPNGAIGILGDTRNSPSWANTALLKGYIDAIWPNAIPTYGPATSQRRLGDILNHGKMYMMTQIGTFEISSSTAQNELRLWHVFGDPTLEIWTSCPYLIPFPRLPELYYIPKWKPQLWQVHVPYPEEGALITVLQQDPRQGLPIPIARGLVQDGVAKMAVVQEPVEGRGFEVAATMPGRLGASATFDPEP